MSDKAAEREPSQKDVPPLLSQWSRQYHAALARYFRRRMPASADPEDLVQEVFLKLAKRDDLALIEAPERYLFHAAANVLKDWRRRRTTRAADSHDTITDAIDDGAISPEREVIGRDQLGRLIQALEAMPERTRAIFMLYHFEHLPHAEIASRLGVAVRTVEDHVARANARLLSELRPGR